MSAAVATAVRHLQDGRRDHAVQLLTGVHDEDPADYRVTHALALMTLWQLVNQPGRTRPADWSLCLGLWASLLADPRFWTWFADHAARRYRTEVLSAHVDTARERLEQWLSEAVTRGGGDGVAALLAVEVRAARVVAVRGGLAVSNGRRPIACGPLLIRHLGLQEACQRFTARLWTSDDEQIRRCALYFSQLGPPRVLLDTGAPTAALASLVALQCATCQRLDPDRRGATAPAPRVCRTGCPTFTDRNPSYAVRVDTTQRFHADALALTIEAHLGVAAAAIGSADLDPPTARQHWLEALRLARTHATFDQIEQHLNDLVLKRVRFLRTARRDDAITLLEALPLPPMPSAEDQLFGEAVRTLSELLAQRGVDVANSHPLDLTPAVTDLRRAAGANPASWYACRNLVVVLGNLAGQAVRKLPATDADLDRAATLLAEALQKLTAFPPAIAGQDIGELRDTTSRALGDVVNSQAIRAHERGAQAEALRLIDRALTLLPGDQRLLENRQLIHGGLATGSDATPYRDVPNRTERVKDTVLDWMNHLRYGR